VFSFSFSYSYNIEIIIRSRRGTGTLLLNMVPVPLFHTVSWDAPLKENMGFVRIMCKVLMD